MNDLDREGRRLLALLVEKLRDMVPGNPDTYISYQDVHEHLALNLRGPTYGLSLRHQALDSLANWTQATGKPGITGIIIDRGTSLPGRGYFDLFRKDLNDFAWWEEQVRLSQQFDWSPFLPNE
jgi:hypothetical protein